MNTAKTEYQVNQDFWHDGVLQKEGAVIALTGPQAKYLLLQDVIAAPDATPPVANDATPQTRGKGKG